MYKRTLYFNNPAYLSTRLAQLVVSYPEPIDQHKTVPIEDIGLMILDHQQITITSGLFVKLIQNKVAIVHCCEKHMPISLAQPLIGHTEQMKRFHQQINMSQPLKKNLWKQVVVQKIYNQAALLHTTGEDISPMYKYAAHVDSGDASNQEAIAAAYYWSYLFEDNLEFKRERHGEPPNHFLNFGYAILRAITARSIVKAGLLPSWGIHHRSKYNAYCLADDLMEPYRVYIDELVIDLLENGYLEEELTKDVKMILLKIPQLDVQVKGNTKMLQNAVDQTCKSLYKCIIGEKRSLELPVYEQII